MITERLPYDATTPQQVLHYYSTRAVQAAVNGYVWNKVLEPLPSGGGFKTKFFSRNSAITHESFFVMKQFRGDGLSTKALKTINNPILTSHDCGIIDFLEHHAHKYSLFDDIFDSAEYKLVEQLTGHIYAKRSGICYMNHVDEALVLLSMLGCNKLSMRAFCLHPLLQLDQDLKNNYKLAIDQCGCDAVALAIEYRNIANQYLSFRPIGSLDEIALSPIEEVNQMLLVDKIQNCKDFILYHKKSHPTSKQLTQYFVNWLKKFDALDSFSFYMSTIENITKNARFSESWQ